MSMHLCVCKYTHIYLSLCLLVMSSKLCITPDIYELVVLPKATYK